MFKGFVSYIKNKELLIKSGHYLVAVSGGVDSMVLCDLLKKTDHKFSVAHCNFKLRGTDSDNDESFVKEYCHNNGIKFYTRSFDTDQYAEQKKISIQMAARELRYTFFNELVKEHSFTAILTAHHMSDNVETFLINLIRGSGISGLKGITEKQDGLIRPLLHFTKDDIERYAKEHDIKFRTDQSNFEDHYLRNNIRLNIISRLKELNPSLEQTISKELALLNQYQSVIDQHFKKEISSALKNSGKEFRIDIHKIKKSSTPELFLFELLKPFGFHPNVVSSIFESLEGISGKLFYSDTHQLVKDREELIITEYEDVNIVPCVIQKNTTEINSPIHLKMAPSQNFDKAAKKNVAFIDSSKIEYPLIVRPWKTGDRFKPLGMQGFKKLSDLFVDLKLNAFEKKKTMVIENGNKEIIWVINHRLDDRYKISDDTNSILKIELVE